MVQVFPDAEKLIIGFNPVACMKRYAKESISIRTAQKENIVTLKEIACFYTSDTPVLLLEAWLYNLNDFVNVQNKLKENQITEVAFLIYNHYSDLNIAELTLIFKRIKMGHYGPLYGNLSGESICRWFAEFQQEKAQLLIKQQEQDDLRNSMTCKQRSEGVLTGLLERFPDMLKEIRETRFGGRTISIGGVVSKIKNDSDG